MEQSGRKPLTNDGKGRSHGSPHGDSQTVVAAPAARESGPPVKGGRLVEGPARRPERGSNHGYTTP